MIIDTNSSLRQFSTAVGILFIAAFLLVLPMIVSGIPTGNDLPNHYRFALGIQESLANGIVFPGWDAIANSGFGDAGLRFYPPLSYLVMNTFVWLSGDWYAGSLLTLFTLFLVGGVGVYLWASEWFSTAAAIFGAIAYMSLPYHVNQIYNAFLYAEFAAAAFTPFCFWFLDRISKKPSLLNAALLGIAYSLVVLTHIPTALMLSAGLFIYALILFWKQNVFTGFVYFVSGIGIGLLVSAFYLVRLINETEFLHHSQSDFTSSDFDFRRNFLLSYFYSSGTEYLDRSLWFGDIMLVLTIAFLIPFVLFYRRSNPQLSARSVDASIGLLALAFFFATPLSSPIWSNFSTLAMMQFPFRWMCLITLSASFIIAAGFRPIIECFRTSQRATAILALSLAGLSLSFTAFQIMKPARSIESIEFRMFVKSLRESESCECWWPIWAKAEAFTRPEQIIADDRNIEVKKWETLERTFEVGPGESRSVRIRTFYYPYWNAAVNGELVKVRPDDNGSILIDLPEGSASITLSFEEPLINRIFGIVSLLAFAFLLLFFAVNIFQTRFRIVPADSRN